jgi:hypothetical protein
MGERPLTHSRDEGRAGRCATLFAALGLALAGADPAGASTVLSTTTEVFGSATAVYSFDAPSAGTLNVQLTDLGWPTRLASLTATIYSPLSSLGSLSAAGDLTVLLSGPSDLSAFISAQAQGALNLGLYSLDITFSPSTSPVPLPSPGLLLTCGVGILGTIGWRWRRREEGAP